MWSASFKAVDELDHRGTWEEITSGAEISDSQHLYDTIAPFPFQPLTNLPVGYHFTYEYLKCCMRKKAMLMTKQDHPQDSMTSRPWMRILLAALSRGSWKS